MNHKKVIMTNVSGPASLYATVPLPVGATVDFIGADYNELIDDPNLRPDILSGKTLVNDGTRNLLKLEAITYLWGSSVDYTASYDANYGNNGAARTSMQAGLKSLGLTIHSPLLQDGKTKAEPMLFLYDATRDKNLSIAEIPYKWSESTVTNRDWIQVGSAYDSNSGNVMPFPGTIVRLTAFCAKVRDDKGKLRLFIESKDTGIIATFNKGEDQRISMNFTPGYDFEAGDRLRFRGEIGDGGRMERVNITLSVKWSVH